MANIATYKTAKKISILDYLMLFGLLGLSRTIQAATPTQQLEDRPASYAGYDYSLQKFPDQVSPIQDKTYLDIEEMSAALAKIVKAIPAHAQPDIPRPQLLAMVTHDPTTKGYCKYLFASNGLLAGSLAQQKAHNLNYHLVKAPEGPVIWQVLSFLGQQPKLKVEGCVLPKDTQLCLPCAHMCMHLFDKKLPVHKAGCQGRPWPKIAPADGVVNTFYSSRFSDQQRQMTIAAVGDVFVKKASPKLSQPLQPTPTHNQLHAAVQLNFSLTAIKLLLNDPKVRINALDSSGKTALDYATPGSVHYSFLVKKKAKNSQQHRQPQSPVLTPSTGAHQDVAVALPPGQLLIPANGNCLYTTVVMGYLFPVRQDMDEVTARIDQLFGMQPADYFNKLYQTLQNPTHYLPYLHSDLFGRLVVDFMQRMKIKKGTWGGPVEIQTIATKLKVNIQAYYPDPSNRTNLVSSDLTKPAQASSAITLHIVQDRVHPAEVLTQAEKISAADNPHYQHYRLKYTFPPSIPAPAWASRYTTTPLTPILPPTEAATTALPVVPYELQPLKKLLKTPHQIAWQGWVDMATYGGTLQETYAIVTIAGTLYTLQERPNPYIPKATPSVDRTISLVDYGFVLNIDVHKPNSFVLAQVNPNNMHTLTADNTFVLESPITDTLADDLISYVVQNDLDAPQINRFLDWLIAEEMDEEALIADIMDDLPAQSNIYQHFPALYELISLCLPKIHQDKTHSNALIGLDQAGMDIANPLLYALRTIPHHYVYINTQRKQAAICALGLTPTLVEDRDQEKQQTTTPQDIPMYAIAGENTPQQQGDLDPIHKQPLRSRRGWVRHTKSATPHRMDIETADYHLVPLVYQIAGDHTTTTTCYCLVPPDYTTTYHNLVKLLTTHQGMTIQQLTYLHSDKPLQEREEKIDWHIAKQKAFQVYFDLAPHFLQIPSRTLWQGWVVVRQHDHSKTPTYCLVTDDDKLYLSTGRNSLNSPNPQLTATIDLADYSFVALNPSDPNSFIVAANDGTLTPEKSDMIFSFYPSELITSQPTTINTLQDELIHYCIQIGIEEKEILQLLDWLTLHEMDEEALIADMGADTPQLTTTSNLAKELPAIFSKVDTFVKYQKKPHVKNELTDPLGFVYRQDDKPSTLLNILRQATHQYYYVESKLAPQPMLAAFDQATPLDTSAYRLVQISCQTPSNNASTKRYCLLPPDYQPTYQAFAQLLQAYFHTSALQLTSHNKNTALETNQNTIHWDTKTNQAFTITLPTTVTKKALFRLVKPSISASPALAQGKNQQQQDTPATEQERGRKEPLLSSPQGGDLFADEAKFAKIDRLDLWALDSLQQLQPPRLLLKKLLIEVIENGCKEDLLGCDFSPIKMVKYVTPKECPWLAKVQAKIDCDRHDMLGKPLNIAEMAAIKLYTDSKHAYLDLGWAQRSGNFSRWPVWDQLLMTALLKLHLAALHRHQKPRYNTYASLAGRQWAEKEKTGFFTTYVSTSRDERTTLLRVQKEGMMMCVTPEIQQQFINSDVSWISQYAKEEAVLFARSADIVGFLAPKWKATVQGYGEKKVQKVTFSPAFSPLIISKGTTHILPAQAIPHTFSYISLEEDAILTIVPWQLNQPNGGHLAIRCYGDCMLGKNAKITVSYKGYSGSASPHYYGHGPKGGATGTYCAAGGSNRTAGGSGHCCDAFHEATTYHASSHAATGQVILSKDHLCCGSGGGYLDYPHSNNILLSTGAPGASGGGALYLEIDGELQLAENSAFLATGGEATPFTGGAGSGGAICLALKGQVVFSSSKAQLCINAQGGGNQQSLAPSAQGAGGAGHITLYMNEYNQEALKRFVVQPSALVLRSTQVKQRKDYKHTLVDDYLIAQEIPFSAVERFWQWLEREEMEEDAIMDDMEVSTPSQSNIYQFDKAIFGVLQKFMAILAPQELPSTSPATPLAPTTIPDHVTMTSKYYNAQGAAHVEKTDYPQAALFHKEALALQTKKYGEQPHADKADTLLYCAKVATCQGNYPQAIKDSTAALEIREKLYQAETPAHPAIIEVHNQLGWLDYQQGCHTQALQRLEATLQLWEKHHGDQQDLLLVNTYHYIGLVHQAMHDYDKAQIAYTTYLTVYEKFFGDQPNPDNAHTHYVLGEIYRAQKAYDQALHHTSKALTIRQALYQQMHHPLISKTLSQLGSLYATQAQYDNAIHYYALATRYQVNHLSAIDQNLARFVPINASRQKRLEQGEQPSSLHEKSILPFLHHSPAQVMLLHGEAGAGKSLYGRFLEKVLWTQSPKTLKEMAATPYTIPLFINLPALQDPTQNAISQALLQYGWDKETIAHFKAQLQQRSAMAKPSPLANEEEKETEAQQDEANANVVPLGIDASFVIILDGYDEINHLTKPFNLYAAHQLNEWHAKIVVTCRTEHLASLPDHAKYFIPDGKSLVARYIRPFDAQQIDHYLDKIVAQAVSATVDTNASDKGNDPTAADTLNADHWTKENYQNAFAKIPSLQKLVMSPLLLCIITTILPQLPTKDHSTLTRTAVYNAFAHQWIEKVLTRMRITGEEAQQKASAAKAYAAALGFELFFQEAQVLRTNSPDKAWQRFFADKKALTYLPLLPLRKVSAHQYQFIHPSYLAFFAAQHIRDSLAHLHAEQEDLQAYFAQQVVPYQPADREVATQDNHTYSRYATSCPPINQKLLKTAPAIIAFLRDSFSGKQAAPFQQWLLQVIKASTHNPKVATAASNAVTLLVAGRIPLGGYEWPHIQIPDAILDGAFLAYTNLQGANLNRVSLREAHLEGVQCQQAQVVGLQFGEYPYLKHHGAVFCISWSHDNQFLASASDDHTVRVWETKTGQQVQTCKGHDNYINSLSWSHDDRFLASASDDKSVRVWDAQTGQQVQICQGHEYDVINVSWSHDDAFFASTSRNNIILLWDLTTDVHVKVAGEHHYYVYRASWSHDDRFLASGSNNKEVRIWDPWTEEKAKIYQGHTGWVQSVSWSHDDRFLASASNDKSVRVWDTKTDEQVQICLGHERRVNSVHWSHDDRFLASASEDNTVRVWDPQTGAQVQVYQGHTDWVQSVCWSYDGNFLASASNDKSVRLWCRQRGPQAQIFQGHSDAVTSVSWSHDDRFLASTSGSYEDSDDNTMRVWDAKTGLQVQICQGHSSGVTSVHWSHDDRFLASASKDKTVRLWDTRTGQEVKICQGHEKEVTSVRWSYDDRFLTSASKDHTVRVWDPRTGAQVQICQGHTDYVRSVSWSHDDRFLASASKDHTVRVWDPQTGKQVQICKGHEKEVTSVCWSHDNALLASASGDNTVRVWNPKTGAQVQIFQGHKYYVTSVRWSHDDSFLASASEDKSVRVWDRKTGQQVQICLGHDNAVLSVSWSHDDRFLASASDDKTVRVWDRLMMLNDESSTIIGTYTMQIEVLPAQSKEKGKSILLKECRPVLVIGKWNGLVLNDADFSGAVGLSEMNKQLIYQRNGIVAIVKWFEAAKTGNRKWLETLYHNYINFRDAHNNTALIVSVRERHLDCVKFLLEKGAGIHLQDKEGNTALLWSAHNGHLACLKYLVEQNANIHDKNAHGYTALLWSAKKGHSDCLKYLIQGYVVDVHHKDNNGYTALLWSAEKGHFDCLKFLIQQGGANIHDQDKDGNTALLWSAEKGYFDCLKYLIQQGADIDHRNNRKSTSFLLTGHPRDVDRVTLPVQQSVNIPNKDKNGDTALILSAREGHLDCITYLVQQNANIHDQNKDGDTALILSAREGYLDCITYLVKKGANIDHKNKGGHTALMACAQRGHLACVTYLVAQGTDIHNKTESHKKAELRKKKEHKNLTLILSAKEGHVDCVKFLFQQGANIYTQDKFGNTALLWSARNGHLACLKYLVAQGAKIDAQNKNETIALLLNNRDVNSDCIQLQLQEMAYINIRNKKGDTALILSLSARQRRLACVKWLVQQGANINGKNNNRDTALILSARFGYLACVKWLVAQGADIDDTDKHGDTALIWSAYKGDIACVQFLVQQGADINISNNKGHSALVWSAHRGRLDIVKYLVQQGADINAKDKYDNTALILSSQYGHEQITKFLVQQIEAQKQ